MYIYACKTCNHTVIACGSIFSSLSACHLKVIVDACQPDIRWDLSPSQTSGSFGDVEYIFKSVGFDRNLYIPPAILVSIIADGRKTYQPTSNISLV